MKLDFNKPLLLLTGQQSQENLGKILADLLVSETKGDVFKYYDWAKTLYQGEPVDLDRADQSTVKDFIKNSDKLIILAKAQMLQVFDDAEKKSEKKLAKA